MNEPNEFAQVLSSVRPSPRRYRIVQMLRHWRWRWLTRNKPMVFTAEKEQPQ